MFFAHHLENKMKITSSMIQNLGSLKLHVLRLQKNCPIHKLDLVVVHSSMISKECNWGAQLKTLCTMNLEVGLLGVL
jgi:hypothetical protein